MSTKTDIDNGARSYADQAGHEVNSAIERSQRLAHRTLDELSDSIDALRSQARPALHRFADEAGTLARRGVDAVRDGSHHLRESALRASDSAGAYVRHEPVKAILIATAACAVTLALVTLFSRSRNRRY